MRRELVKNRLDDKPLRQFSKPQLSTMTYRCNRHPVVRRSAPSKFCHKARHKPVRITTSHVCSPSRMTSDLGVASLRILQLSRNQ